MNAFSQKTIAANLAEFAHLCGQGTFVAVETKAGRLHLRALTEAAEFDRAAGGIGFPTLSTHLEKSVANFRSQGRRHYLGVQSNDADIAIVEITDANGTFSTTAVLPAKDRKDLEPSVRAASRTLEHRMNALRSPEVRPNIF